MTDLICPDHGRPLLSLPYAAEHLTIDPQGTLERNLAGELMPLAQPLKYGLTLKTQGLHDGGHMTFLPGQRLLVGPRQMLHERITDWPHRPARRIHGSATLMTPDYRHHAFIQDAEGRIHLGAEAEELASGIAESKDGEERTREEDGTDAFETYRFGYRPLLMMQVVAQSQHWDPKAQRHSWTLKLAEI